MDLDTDLWAFKGSSALTGRTGHSSTNWEAGVLLKLTATNCVAIVILCKSLHLIPALVSLLI